MISQCPCEALLNNKVLVLRRRRGETDEGWRKEGQNNRAEVKRNDALVMTGKQYVRLQGAVKERETGRQRGKKERWRKRW